MTAAGERPAYIDVTQEAGMRFFGNPDSARVVMLNLLKFRDVADYTAFPDLAPDPPISGAQAYDRYMKAAEPFLAASGGRLLFAGTAGPFLIGPANEDWDFVMLVEQASRQAFLAFASDPDYLKIVGHRTAAIADSRLLPISPGEDPIG